MKAWGGWNIELGVDYLVLKSMPLLSGSALYAADIAEPTVLKQQGLLTFRLGSQSISPQCLLKKRGILKGNALLTRCW